MAVERFSIFGSGAFLDQAQVRTLFAPVQPQIDQPIHIVETIKQTWHNDI